MGKPKDQTQSSGVIVGKRHLSFSRRKKVLLVFIIILVIIVAGGVYWYISGKPLPFSSVQKVNVTTTNTSDAALQVQSDTYNKAIATATSGGPAAGQAVLDTELQTTTNPTDKATIYSQKSSLAGSSTGGNDYTSALEYAKQADVLNPTSQSAAALATICQSMGDKQQAIMYYQLAQSRIGDPSKADLMTQSDYGYYAQQIEALQNAN